MKTTIAAIVLPAAAAIALPAAAQDKEVWTSLGTNSANEEWSLDFSRQTSAINEFGTPVTRIWVQVLLPQPGRVGEVRQLIYYEIDCPGDAARMRQVRGFGPKGNVLIDATLPSVPMDRVRQGSAASSILENVCKPK